MNTEFLVRQATVADIAILARHRAAMFRDMGKLPDALVENMIEASRLWDPLESTCRHASLSIL